MTTEDFALPTVGPTGSPIVKCEHGARQENQRYERLPPSPPEREQPLYDDDGEIVGWRTLTSEEFAAATLFYERDSADWKKTGGVYFVAGHIIHTVDAVCADGCVAKAVGDGRTWHWTEWATTQRPTAPAT